MLHKMAQLRGLGYPVLKVFRFINFHLSDVPAMRVLYRQQLDLLPLRAMK